MLDTCSYLVSASSYIYGIQKRLACPQGKSKSKSAHRCRIRCRHADCYATNISCCQSKILRSQEAQEYTGEEPGCATPVNAGLGYVERRSQETGGIRSADCRMLAPLDASAFKWSSESTVRVLGGCLTREKKVRS